MWWADRWNRYRILVVTQTLSMIQAFILAYLTLRGVIVIWQVISLGFLLGIVNAFDGTARQAFVVEMVEDREDLTNAIALNSLLFNGARLLGPSIAGVLIALLGEGMCFLINALSYVAVIGALLAMRITPREIHARSAGVLKGLQEGLRYSFREVHIRSILSLLGLVSLFGMPYTVLMPVFARDIFLGGAHTLGSLMSATGVGAVVGAFYLASRRSIEGLGRILLMAAAVFGASLICMSFSRLFWLSMVLMAFTGFGMIVQMAFQQYPYPEPGRGQQAGKGDEPLQRGFSGNGAVRHPDGGQPGGPHRDTGDPAGGRSSLRPRGGDVLSQNQRHPTQGRGLKAVPRSACRYRVFLVPYINFSDLL